jgi:hypothetical protein
MRWMLLLFALPTLFACQPLDPVEGWDPGGSNCAQNTAPFIDNVQVNSAYVGEVEQWILVVGFNWADPGTGGASDPPNLRGGEFSIELSGIVSDDILLTEGILESGCTGDTDPEVGTATYCSLLTIGGGCPNGGVSSCGTASLSVPGYIVPASDDNGVAEGDIITMEMRIRDTCGMTSNSKTATYALGQGLIVENGPT